MPKRVPSHRPPPLPRGPDQYERRPTRQADKNFYCSVRWRSLRSLKLAESPLCEECRKAGRVTAAAHVHHKVPRKTRPDLAHDFANLEALCQPCHNAMDER